MFEYYNISCGLFKYFLFSFSCPTNVSDSEYGYYNETHIVESRNDKPDIYIVSFHCVILYFIYMTISVGVRRCFYTEDFSYLKIARILFIFG